MKKYFLTCVLSLLSFLIQGPEQRKSSRGGFLGGLKGIWRYLLEILPLKNPRKNIELNLQKTKKTNNKQETHIFLNFPRFSLFGALVYVIVSWGEL